MAQIDTAAVANRMRSRIIDRAQRRILISRLAGSGQEDDLTSPVNAGGLGRVRHFRLDHGSTWPRNFLPIAPAAAYLGLEETGAIEAQVFQNAACAWRCWYCYVPFELLAGDTKRAEWISADELVERYAALAGRPPVLDLSGGSPDLTPEWAVWTRRALDRLDLSSTTYLWSDDNLSTDYVFEFLTADERAELARPGYGRVCCFKGFDPASFAFNTRAREEEWERQFDRFSRYLELGWDLYAYVTLTGPSLKGVEEGIGRLVERLKALWSELPQRTVPLRIEPFGPLLARNDPASTAKALEVQERAIGEWSKLVPAAPLQEVAGR